ncbi:carboxypeptidase-like regulatory domain-containing protein [Aquimarina sediminis]|uniref:carboxypeptidase-like regulatory domain-containing protein n=1 Tax=Aquimarina sediminis TaxID=2070536 RepID=UPI000FFE4742|nr:carboxypeptidase-like regulatory domain-containing protein [Aquimarina sediminis]
MRYYFFKAKCGLLILLFNITFLHAQHTEVRGKIVDAITDENLENVIIQIKNTYTTTYTNALGEFNFSSDSLPVGEQILIVSKERFVTKRFPIVINQNSILDLKKIDLHYDFEREQQIGTISLSDQELNETNYGSISTAPLLQSTRDIFLTAAAFDFSTTFFRPRGLGNENGKVLINGITMNKIFNGRPQWSNWGGLNDVQRNQEFSEGISPNDYDFGGLLGTTNISMRASQYRKGGKLSYATSNRSYRGRVMATYNSGTTTKGWAFSLSLSRRYANEGFVEGTLYDANSVFVSVEKKLGNNHSLNLTGFYTPNRRGRSTAITQEVFNLKGNRYNPNWGYQDKKLRNSRERKVKEPIVMLNHYWKITKNTLLNTNLAFQTGSVGNSRIDNGGSDLIIGSNGQQTYIGGGRSADTNPVHPDNLPSSFLENSNPTPLDYQNAYLAQQNLLNNGQLDWNKIIQTNQQNTQQGNNATYILYEDRTDDTQLNGNMILHSKINKHLDINAVINYRNLKSQNFAEVTDLLGGTSFLDVDIFALSARELTSYEQINRAQSDLRNPNRKVKAGDRYDYNYEINATTIEGFAQGQFKYNRISFFLGGNFSQTSYQRNGLFENGYFPGSASFGKSTPLDFINYGIKGGITLNINNHNFIKLQGAYFNKAPSIRNAFVNARQNNKTITQLLGETQENEKIQSADASYIFRSPKIKAKLTGYYIKMLDATNISFFFTEAISGSDIGFVQEILTDIDKLHIGGELGIEYQITPTLKLKAAAAAGDFVFDNNPGLTLTSTSDVFSDSEGVRNFGKSTLKGYHIAGGPQRAAQVGFEYRDPDFWWFGATTNYFSNAYINISPFARTSNFYQDADGLPFNDYDENVAKHLLKQEQFKDYFLVNAIGGKSWKIKKYNIGFFISVNNIFNQEYKTGGFEQARNANYRLALEESKRDTPVFGPKYFFGLGTSYYLNVYVRF